MIPTQLTKDETRDFLWESWRFVKQIFPLLIVGVFAVGVIRELIKPEWIQAIAGENTILGNFVGVVFGVFMYFPTLVEVPIAQMFLNLGMHRGPLLAYLISDPELSLQSILITSFHHRTTESLGLCGMGSSFQHDRRFIIRSMGKRNQPGSGCAVPGSFPEFLAGIFWFIRIKVENEEA